jgi:hypothetical protein
MDTSGDRLTIEKLHSETKRAGELVTGFLLVTGLISTLLGIVAVASYLSAYSLPLAPVDTSLSFAIQILGVLFVLWIGLLTIYCFIPLVGPFFLLSGSRAALPHLQGRPSPGDTDHQRGLPNFLLEYFIFYLNLYVVTLSGLVAYLFELTLSL